MSGYQRFRKRPVVIEAIQYLPPTNREQVWGFLEWPWPRADLLDECYHDDEDCDEGLSVFISTLEGVMEADPEDWIIRGIKGESYPCKPDIFAASYEEVL